MIIKKISIENYLCYYNSQSFHFEDGLNIILGENNEGKTKFFEAVEWLFNGTINGLDNLISAKKLKETSPDDNFRVSVSMLINKFNHEYKFTRSFIVKKSHNDEIEISSFIFEGEDYNINSGERIPKNGKTLLNETFPFEIRKYSMFKGETELNIFENEEALLNLIELFSKASSYEKYTKIGTFLRLKADKAVETSTRQNQNNQIAYNALELKIYKLEQESERLNVHLNLNDIEKTNLELNINEAEKYVDNADALQTIKNRIENIEEKIRNLNLSIKEDYTTYLFDENWILLNFESIHESFSKKITHHSILKRELQSDFDKEKGIKEGEIKAITELLNNAVPLPIGVPSKFHMKEMIEAEICKVCNREAKKGSEEYEFMMKRLNSYLESQKVEVYEEDKDRSLFKFDYISRLIILSMLHEDNLKNLRSVRSNIEKRFDLNKIQKSKIEELTKQLETESAERAEILGNSNIANEDKLINIFKNYTAWQENLKDLNKTQFAVESKLNDVVKELKTVKEEKDNIDIKSAHTYLLKTRDILRQIETIFIQTKEIKFDEFIKDLEEKSNKFLSQINMEAFTGQIKFSKKKHLGDKIKIEVSLFEKEGRNFLPGTAVRTSMNISILLAISELANDFKKETYPMIFDAPTSSFGETKTGDFLSLINATSNQKIILLKDFIGSSKKTDGSLNELFIKKEFNSVKFKKAFWVKLNRPFDKNDISTIDTQVIVL